MVRVALLILEKEPPTQPEMDLLQLLKKPVPNEEVKEAKSVDLSDEEVGGHNGNEQNAIEMSPQVSTIVY